MSDLEKALERMLTYKVAGKQEDKQEMFSQININDYNFIKQSIEKKDKLIELLKKKCNTKWLITQEEEYHLLCEEIQELESEDMKDE